MSDTEAQDYQTTLSPSSEKMKAVGSSDADSSDESEEVIRNGDISESSSTENTKSKASEGVTNGSETDSEDEGAGIEKDDVVVTNGNSVSDDAEDLEALQPKKASMDSVSSDTDEDAEDISEAAESEKKTQDVTDVSVKPKSAVPVYDDDNNDIDDMLADLPRESPERDEPIREASPEPVENVAVSKEEAVQSEDEEEEAASIDHTKSPSPVRSPSPDQERTRSPTPERKDSRGSHGSSSYDDERASSLSPEPPKVIAAPMTKVMSPTSPVSPRPTSQSKSPITKIYTDKIITDSDGEESGQTKQMRQKPASDITQIYTQKLAQAESPKPERAKFVRPSRDITQLYTAALHKTEPSPSRAGGDCPKRTGGDITKLYTGGLGQAPDSRPFKGKPNDERTNPTKHNMSTAIDKEAIKEAYIEVMADNNGIEWATFIFKDNKLGVTAKGSQFNEFKSQFGPDDRGFGYIKVMTGDEMSKRSKFVMCTWVGPNVSVMKKAKMSTDKALMKDIIQNLSVELQCENANELTMDHFKQEVDKAGGARYGTGVRDH